MGKCILITGGARSGKSSFSEELAKTYGDKVLYIATAIPFDEEMKERIKRHKERRPKSWTTIEDYKNISGIINNGKDKYQCILLDCITVMLTNLLLEYFDYNTDSLTIKDYDEVEKYLIGKIHKMTDSIENTNIDTIMVTNEVGWGIVPENLISRAYRDICGRVNQILGRKANEVYLVVSGVPVKVKG